MKQIVYPSLVAVLIVPLITLAQNVEIASARTYYLASDDVSLLQHVFGIATSPELMMFLAAVTLMLLVGFSYLAFGVIVFFLFRN